MYRILTLFALAGLSLSVTACKPTYRKVPGKDKQTQQAPQPAEQAPAPEQSAPEQVQEPPAPPVQQEQVQAPETYSDCLLSVRCVTQEFNHTRPWEKTNPGSARRSAIYIGDGKVLVSNISPETATFVELSLPDGSRTVPARIVKFNADLGLALLTVAHEDDASIFETRKAYPLGDALRPGDKAELWCVVRGSIPTAIPLRAESGEDDGNIPLISMKMAQPLPGELYAFGAPVVQDGKIVALSNGYSRDTQAVSCVNAEILQRFLGEDGTASGVPVLGLTLDPLNDPAFRRYLKVGDSQNGLYISKVVPGGAADAAGIKAGDVLLSIEGQPLDSQGRWQHPIYGPTDAGVVIRCLKPLGETVTLGVSRGGEKLDVTVPLNRDAEVNALPAKERPGVQPRYVVWGGLLFQPVTKNYLEALRGQAHSLPVQFLRIDKDSQQLRDKGVTEVVALTQVIPTPATLGYEKVAYSVVEKVNGKEIHNFAEFVEALDAPTPDGLLHLSINRAPYEIHVDRQAAEASNDALRRNAFLHLRHLGEMKK